MILGTSMKTANLVDCIFVILNRFLLLNSSSTRKVMIEKMSDFNLKQDFIIS